MNVDTVELTPQIFQWLVNTLMGAMATMFFMLMRSKDRQIKRLEQQQTDHNAYMQSELNLYREIALRTVGTMRAVVNHQLTTEGKPPLVIVAPVLPEHASPVTDKQQASADLETLKAEAVAVERAAQDLLAKAPIKQEE